jgi:hypothetical protein
MVKLPTFAPSMVMSCRMKRTCLRVMTRYLAEHPMRNTDLDPARSPHHSQCRLVAKVGQFFADQSNPARRYVEQRKRPGLYGALGVRAFPPH